MTSTLQDIKTKVRRLTASHNTNQLSESDLEQYINTFYESDLPAHLKLWKLRDKYTFFTEPNEDRYQVDTGLYNTFQQPLYIDGNEAQYTQSQTEFYRLYPKQNHEETLGAGDGSASYAFTLSKTPMAKRLVSITAVDGSGNQQVAQDDGDGGFTDPNNVNADGIPAGLTGSIDYVTGALTITFPQVIPTTSNIIARTVPYTASRPRTLLYFQDYFLVRPIPDKAYRIELNMYRKPTDLLASAGGDPEINQWWQFIALGAAIKVLQDRQDVDSIANISPFFEEQRQLVLQRTAKQNTQQRVATIYTDQAQGYPSHLGNWG